ncbi:MAG: glypican [Cyanobacteriota bacterium]|nr:glypican [Cyanobacteriota bacterium]
MARITTSRPLAFVPLALPPLPTSLLLLSAAFGSLVLAGLAALTLIPLLVLVGGLVVWILATLLFGWAGIEALAACERWMERQSRFQR